MAISGPACEAVQILGRIQRQSEARTGLRPRSNLRPQGPLSLGACGRNLTLPGPRKLPPIRATSEGTSTEAEAKAEETFPKLKAFLQDLKEVGRVRIIVNTGVAVLESVTTLDGLFYMQFGGKGEYGNLMKNDENVDFHLLLPEVAKVELETAKSRTGEFETHTSRFYNKEGFNAASIFVMWKPGTKGDYDDGQVEAFQKLVEKYGAEITF